MAYNGNRKLIGPKTNLIGDLKEATLAANAGDWMNAWSSRDEAWYEIAFNSDSISNNGTNAFGLEMRYLREAQEFGLYSQSPGWTAGNIQHQTFQTSINLPNTTDGGEEAVAALRVIQDESSSITSFLNALQSRFPTDYKSTLISAAELISEYESPAVKLLNQLYATPYGRSFDASHVIDTLALNGLVEAPGKGSGYMLIGAQLDASSDPSVTGGFVYGLPLSDKLISGPNGGDVLLGFAGNNTLMINGPDNIAFNDVVTIPGVDTYYNSDTITGDHNTLYTSIGAASVLVNGSFNTINLGSDNTKIVISSLGIENLIVLSTGPAEIKFLPNKNYPSQLFEPLYDRFPFGGGFVTDWLDLTGASVTSQAFQSTDLSTRPVIDMFSPGTTLYQKGIIAYAPGFTAFDMDQFSETQQVVLEIDSADQLTGELVNNIINYDPYGSIIGYQRKSPGTADVSNSAAHNIYSGFTISSITQSSAIPQVTGYDYAGPVGGSTTSTTGSTTTTTIKPTVTSLDIITGSTIITGADTLQSILISQSGTGVVDSSQVVTGLFSLQDTNSYYFTGTTESFGYLSSEQPVLSLSGSTLTLDGPFLLTDGNPQFSGTLGVSIVGTGVVDIGTGGFGEISDALFTDGTGNNSVAPDLVVQGSVFQDGVVQLGTGTDSSFISISSTGSYTFVDSSIFIPTPEPGKPVNSLVNNGFMEIAGGNNVLETPIINSGTIDVANGATVTFAGGIVDAGGQLNFSDGADVFFDSPQAMGLPHNGNSISIQPGITYNFDNSLTQPTAFLFGGTDAAVTIDAPSGSAQPQPLISISDVAAGSGSALVQASGTTSQVSLVSGNLNVTVSAGTNQITLGTEADVSVQGGANTILASGSGGMITTTGGQNAISLMGGGSQLVSGGTDQIIAAAAGDLITITGANSAVTLNQTAGAATVVASGANETINGNNVGDVIDAASLQAGSYVILTSTSAVVTLGNAGIAAVGSTGSADTILGAGGTVADFGTNDVMSVTGGVVYTYDTNGSVTAAGAAVMHIGGSGEAVSLADGASSVQDGAAGGSVVAVSRGNLIAVSGPGTYVDLKQAGGAETVLASGANETIRGNDVGDVIEAANLQAGSDVILTSTNAMVTLGNAGIALVGSTGSADTILSAGGTVIDVGTHDVMSVTGGVVYAYGANASVTAAGDSVIVADSAMITTTGGNNLISMGGPGSSVLVASAGQDTVQVAGGLTVQGGAASLVVRNVGSGAVSISQGSGAVTANGGAGAVTLFGGTAGDNVLIGGTGAANMLEAAVGNATLQAAGSGATTLIGGAGAVDFIAAGGAETMLGGTGTGAANRFIFGTNAASVNASIFGFASSTSQIMLEDGVAVTGQSVAARGDLVTLSNGGSILLMGVNAALSAGAVNNGVTVLM